MKKPIMMRRKFVQEMMRLKRNMINFKELEITIPLILELNETDQIGFDLKRNAWTIKTNKAFNSDNWNPKLGELIKILEVYSTDELSNAIKKMEKISKDGYKSIYSEALKPKFEFLLKLMKLEGNQTQPLTKILINDKIRKINYEIACIDSEIVYCIDTENDCTSWMDFTEKDMLKILHTNLYYDIMISLNNLFKELLIKKLPE